MTRYKVLEIIKENPTTLLLFPIIFWFLWFINKTAYMNLSRTLDLVLLVPNFEKTAADIINSFWSNLYVGGLVTGLLFYILLPSTDQVLQNMVLVQHNEIRRYKVYFNSQLIFGFLLVLMFGVLIAIIEFSINHADEKIGVAILILLLIGMLYQSILMGGSIGYVLENLMKKRLSFSYWNFVPALSLLVIALSSLGAFLVANYYEADLQPFNPIYIFSSTLVLMLNPIDQLQLGLIIVGLTVFFILLLKIPDFIFRREIHLKHKAKLQVAIKKESRINFKNKTPAIQLQLDFAKILRSKELLEFSILIFIILASALLVAFNERNKVFNPGLQIFGFLPLVFGFLFFSLKFHDIGLEYILNLAPYPVRNYVLVKYVLASLLGIVFSSVIAFSFFIITTFINEEFQSIQIIGLVVEIMFSGFLGVFSGFVIYFFIKPKRNNVPHLFTVMFFVLVSIFISELLNRTYQLFDNGETVDNYSIAFKIALGIFFYFGSLAMEQRRRS